MRGHIGGLISSRHRCYWLRWNREGQGALRESGIESVVEERRHWLGCRLALGLGFGRIGCGLSSTRSHACSSLCPFISTESKPGTFKLSNLTFKPKRVKKING